jgi:hypothetical protein
MFRVLLILLCCASTAARADLCPGNPDAFGTERILAIDSGISARVERKQFPDTLPRVLLKELKDQGYHVVHVMLAGVQSRPQ